jgi:hypothetical protein
VKEVAFIARKMYSFSRWAYLSISIASTVGNEKGLRGVMKYKLAALYG